MPTCPVIAPDTKKIYLLDTAKRVFKELQARTAPKPTTEALASAERQIRVAEINDDWIEVKKRLSIGDINEGMSDIVMNGSIVAGETARLDPRRLALQKFRSYVTAWSFLDLSGEGLPLDAVNSIDPIRFGEIETALKHHEADIEADAEARKNALTTVSA